MGLGKFSSDLNMPEALIMSLKDSVFSLNFSSASKGRFMAGKAQDMCQRCTFLGGGGDSRARDTARPLLRNFGVTFSETSFPIF